MNPISLRTASKRKVNEAGHIGQEVMVEFLIGTYMLSQSQNESNERIQYGRLTPGDVDVLTWEH